MENNNINNYEEDPQIEKMKYKNILMLLLIFVFVIIKLCSHQIQIKDFFRFYPINISFQWLYEIKEYLIFFAIIIPVSYFLWKSNMKWAQEQIDLMEEKEEKKKKEKELKRQEEFENKMRGIHFKGN